LEEFNGIIEEIRQFFPDCVFAVTRWHKISTFKILNQPTENNRFTSTQIMYSL
jgi:hypothetical protein